MTELLASVAALALIDSLNPSALAVTVYLLLATRRYVSRVLAYVSGIYLTYLGIGVLLVLGLDPLVDRVGEHLQSDAGYVAQGVLGALLLLYSSLRLRGGHRPARRREPRSHRLAGVFGLGVVISVVEFGTALPYLGAIGILTAAGTPLTQALPVLAGYNLVMVTPPLLVMLAYGLLGDRIKARLQTAGDWLLAQASALWLNILQAAGALLVINCLHHFRVWERF